MTTKVILSPAPELQPAPLLGRPEGGEARPWNSSPRTSTTHVQGLPQRRFAAWCDAHGIGPLASGQDEISDSPDHPR